MTASRVDVAALEAALDEPQVTPRPWTAEGRAVLGPIGYNVTPVVAEDYGVVLAEDAALIVASVNAAPALVALVRAVEALADELDDEAEHRESVANRHPKTKAWDSDRGLLRANARRQRATATRLRSAVGAALNPQEPGR